jgi:hypothetical protein
LQQNAAGTGKSGRALRTGGAGFGAILQNRAGTRRVAQHLLLQAEDALFVVADMENIVKK